MKKQPTKKPGKTIKREGKWKKKEKYLLKSINFSTIDTLGVWNSILCSFNLFRPKSSITHQKAVCGSMFFGANHSHTMQPSMSICHQVLEDWSQVKDLNSLNQVRIRKSFCRSFTPLFTSRTIESFTHLV